MNSFETDMVEHLIVQLNDANKALRRYGQHERDCATRHHFHAHKGCTCGFQDILDSKGKVDKSG